MRILVHIHTFNDEDVIEQALHALSSQTHPVDEVLVVDNGSEDGTLERLVSKKVTIIKHPKNLGTSGSVKTGLEYALAKQYDWMWVLDADSLPREDALEKLIALYESCDAPTKSRIGVLSCSQALEASSAVFQGRRLTPGGPRMPKVDETLAYCECDSTIWSGSLFRLDAVRRIGLPRCGERGYWEDLSLDYGDVEFTYRMKQAGYKVLVHRFSVIDHPVGRTRRTRILGRELVSTNHSPSRRYLFFRNLVYFWLYLFRDRIGVMFGVWFLYRFAAIVSGVLLLERDRGPKVWACVRGIVDGVQKKLGQCY